MDDNVDLRLLRYFIAVAEERNFTRAAQRLAMAQPPLSRAIRQLERIVGVPLLVRSYRQVNLTAAGASLLKDARALHEQTRAAVQRSRQAAARQPTLQVTAKPIDSRLLRELIDSYRRTGDGRHINPVVTACRRQLEELRSGQADAALIRRPFQRQGLQTSLLLSEPRIALVSAHHRLAGAGHVPLNWLAGDPVPVWRDADTPTDEYWAAADLDHHAWRRGPRIDDVSQLLAVVGTQQAIGFVPRSLLDSHPLTPDVVALEVAGVSDSELHIAWPRSQQQPSIAEFIAHAKTSCKQTSAPHENTALNHLTRPSRNQQRRRQRIRSQRAC